MEEEEHQWTEAAGGEALEEGEEEWEDEVEEGNGGDGPGRKGQGALHDPNTGHGDGEQSAVGSHAIIVVFITRIQGDIGQEVCQVVHGSQAGQAGQVKGCLAPAGDPGAVGEGQAEAWEEVEGGELQAARQVYLAIGHLAWVVEGLRRRAELENAKFSW